MNTESYIVRSFFKLFFFLTFLFCTILGYSKTIAWYEFDKGSQITDSSGNGLNGTIFGSDWTENTTFNIYQNNAKSFNSSGYNTYVSVAHDSAFDCFSNQYTLEFWYKNLGNPSGSIGRIIGKGDAYNTGFSLRLNNSDRKLIWVVVYNKSATPHRIYLTSSTALQDNQWHHIAVTAEDIQNGNQIDTVAKIYIDGKLDATRTKTDSEGLKTTIQPLQMMGATYYPRGVITKVKISDVALDKFDTPLRLRALHLHLNNIYSSYYDNMIRGDIDSAAASNYTHIILHINNYMDYTSDPLGNSNSVYSPTQIKSLIAYAHSKKLKVIPGIRILTHANEMFSALPGNTNYQPTSPTPGQMVVSSSGKTANPYYSYNGHTFTGITTNIITEVLSLFSELYASGDIDYEYPDYILTGFDELQNSELQYFIDNCGSQGDTVRSKYVGTVNSANSIVSNISGGKTKMMMWGDMFLSKKLANAPYNDTDFLTYRGAFNGTADNVYLAVLNQEISSNIVIADWNYSINTTGYPSIKYFSNKGYQTIGTSWYNLEAIQCWSDYIHNNLGGLTNVIGMSATSWSDNNRYIYYRADRFESMLTTSGSLFLEIGSVEGMKNIPAATTFRCYAKDNSLYYLNTFFNDSGNDTIYLSAYVNDTETPQGQLTGTFYVKPHSGTSWTAATSIFATDKNITNGSGTSLSLTCHGGYDIPYAATTGPWDVKFVYYDADSTSGFDTSKDNYVVRENAFIINSTGITDFTKNNCIASYNFNLSGNSVPNDLPGSSASDGTITGNDYQADTTLYSYFTAGKSFNTSGYNTYVSIPNNSAFDCFGDQYTLEFWYKNSGDPSHSIGRIIGKGDAYNSGFSLRLNNSDRKLIWVVVYNKSATPHRIYLTSSTTLQDNQWHHIAVTAEDIQNGAQIDTVAKIYIDGKLDATATKTDSEGLKTTTQPLQMMGSAYYPRGAVADVKIYNSALSEDDLKAGVFRADFDEDVPSAYSITADHSRFFNLSNTANISFSSPGASGTGKCAYFNGTNSKIKFPYYENLELEDSFYVRFKLKITDSTASHQVIIQNGSSYGRGFEIRLIPDRNFYIRLWTWLDDDSGNSTANGFSTTTNPILLNQWVDVVLTFDSQVKQIKLYVDGTLVKTVNTSTGKRVKAKSIYLGSFCGGSSLPFGGYVDELIIDNSVYSP